MAKSRRDLKDFFQLPLKVPSTNLPPLAPIRTSACEAHHYPRAVWFTSKTDKLVLGFGAHGPCDPPACLCTHGKKAVWAALVQNKPEVIQLYKRGHCFVTEHLKHPRQRSPTSTTTTQCVAFLKRKAGAW